MKAMLGDEYEEFERVFKSGAPYTAIRINSAKKGARERVLGVTGALEGVEWCADGYYADKSQISGNHPYHFAGLFYFQEPSAMTVGEAADIQKDDFVLDLCAAPGGKSTHILSKLGGSGLLVSNEISKKRAAVLAENVERFGALNTLVTNETAENMAKRFEVFFDKIIVDAPCSGEGMFRKEPQAIDEWSEAHTMSCAARSKAIAECAVKMLKPGGRLVYSTCTFAPCENEGVVEFICSRFPDMTLVCPESLSMLDGGKGEYIGSGIDYSFTKRVFPHKRHGEGHFVAVFEKASLSAAAVERKRRVKQRKDIADKLLIYREFEKRNINITLDGEFTAFGDNLYRLPDGIDSVDGLRVVRAGLHLGVCKKGRFEPSQALALAFDRTAFAAVLDLAADSDAMRAYLRGETVSCEENGWVCVCADGYPIGWGKASQGVMKNHFPKHMRVMK